MEKAIQEKNYPIKDWAKDDRPREKLRDKGAGTLSNSELLAILINLGTRERSALQLGQDLLKMHHNNLNNLGQATVRELMQVKGIGEAKAVTIVAALELSRRRSAGNILEQLVITSSADVAGYLQNRLGDYRHEVFAVVYLNRSNRIKHFEIISEGGISGTVVDPRIVLKKALDQDATSLILCHNHPSGSLKPSKSDEDLTRKICAAAKYFDMSVLDHLIVSQTGHYSFADAGKI